MRTTITEQLRTAYKASGMSLEKLVEKAGLGIDRSMVGRKLNGRTPLVTGEAEALADALGITITWPSAEEEPPPPVEADGDDALAAESVA